MTIAPNRRPGRQPSWSRWWLLWVMTSLALVGLSGGIVVGRGAWQRSGTSGSNQTVTAVVATEPASSVPQARITGGTFRLGVVGRITTLNPLLTRATAEDVVTTLLFEGLLSVDGSGQPQPALADHWSISDDGRVYTVTLRDDVTWHDGQPLTARDILFTVRLAQDPTFPGDRALSDFWRTVQVELVDARTVRFHLTEPYAPFLTWLSLPVLPEHVLAGSVAHDLATSRFSLEPIGTGPYRVQRVDLRAGEIELVRYEGYWGAIPNFERVLVRLFPSAEEAVASFRQGDLDGLELVPWSAVRQGQLLGEHARVYAPLLSGFTALFLNSQATFFADVRVRQALALALDREAIVRDVLQGAGELGNGPIPPSSWAYQPQQYRYDLAAARQLLRDAGWEDRNGDGVLDKAGLSFRFTLLVNVDDPERVAVAQAIAQQLSELAIAVTVQPVAAQTLQRQLLDREYTAAVFGWMSRYGDPDMFELWHSSQIDLGSNVTGFRSRTVDVLLEKARQAQDLTERRSLYVEFQRLFAEYVPAIVLYYPRYCFVLRDDIGGVDVEPLVRPVDHLHQLPRWYRIAA